MMVTIMIVIIMMLIVIIMLVIGTIMMLIVIPITVMITDQVRVLRSSLDNLTKERDKLRSDLQVIDGYTWVYMMIEVVVTMIMTMLVRK